MEIKPHIIEAINKNKIILSKLSLQEEMKHLDSPLNSAIFIPFECMEITKCTFCNKQNIDYCWNCELPICQNHARTVFFIINRMGALLCPLCAEELSKLK